MALADAAAIPVAALTAWQALFEHGELTSGQRVLVNGAGGGVGGFVYVFKGLVWCGHCHRRMQGPWVNAQSYYRCRYPAEYAIANKIDTHATSTYAKPSSSTRSTPGWPRFSPRPG